MSKHIFNRPPRRKPPAMPGGDLLLESPPDLPIPGQRSMAQLLMLLPMLAMVGAMAFMFSMRGGGIAMMVIGGLFGVSMLGMFLGSFLTSSGDQKGEQTIARRDYMRYLSQTRRQVRRAAAQQRAAVAWRHPVPSALWSITASERLWERRFNDGDFAEIRIGVGKQRLAINMVTPETKPVEDLEPMSALALRRFVRAHSNLPNMPMALRLQAFRRLILTGDDEANRGVIRAMIAQAATFHSPADLMIAVVTSENLMHWDWVKWLPHALLDREVDAAGPRRLVVPTMNELEELLHEELTGRSRNVDEQGMYHDRPHIFVIVDGVEVDADCDLAGAALSGVTVAEIDGLVPRYPRDWLLRLASDAEENTISMTVGGRTTELGHPDALTIEQATSLARRLAKFHPAEITSASEPLAVSAELPDLLGVGDVAQLDPKKTWRTNRPTADRLTIALGLDPQGSKIILDIKEAAQGGMGPHGLIIGATGSGKSELLRTIVTGLAMTHSSEELNFVLVDFKGGATFATLDQLPHTSAVITNLEDELHLVDRMADAISGEMTRRQELLRDAGNFVSQRDYEKARRAGADLPPLPSLLVICDEFSELLSAQPEFIELFVMIGRLGRSLGVHLLLASQRLEEGRLRGLDTHLSYRVGLRTFSAMESRIVLGVPDAYELPNAPGHAYLKIDTATMLRFRSAYVSGPYRAKSTKRDEGPTARDRLIFYSAIHQPLPVMPKTTEVKLADTESLDDIQNSLMAVITRRLHGQGPPAHKVWLEPLGDAPPLSKLFQPLAPDPVKGLRPQGFDERHRLRVPVGIVDRPFEQRTDPLYIDLSGAGGNVLAIGGTQSGKSTALRSIISSLALTHTPAEVQFYCLDFGGGTLRTLTDLPHVGSVAGRRQADQVRRTIAEMSALLDERETAFADAGIDTMTTYRRRKAAGEFSQDPFGDAFLVIDGWTTLKTDFEELEDDVLAIAQRGLGFGIHLMLATNRWTDMRAALRDLLGTRLELRLGDPAESEINRRAAKNVPERTPGRGITPDGMQMLMALPRIDDSSEVEDLTEGVRDMVTRVASAWPQKGAPSVRLLPDQVYVSEVPTSPDSTGIPFGINESHLAPVSLDFAAEPHFVALGDVECGKTNLLRMLASQLAQRYTPKEARFLVIDYRRTLLGEISSDHLAGYAATNDEAARLMRDANEALLTRMPGPDITPEQLRARNWWSGPDLYVIIDDYDIVSGSTQNPVATILDLLAQSRDIGFHLILARRMGGASRAMYEPVIQRLREIQSPGLLMSGSKEEGLLLGDVRAAPRPPGRGMLVRRSGNQLVQTAWSPMRHAE